MKGLLLLVLLSIGCASPSAVPPRPTPVVEQQRKHAEAQRERTAFEVVEECGAPTGHTMPEARSEGLNTTRPGWLWSVPGELPAIAGGVAQLGAVMFGMMGQLVRCELAELSAGMALLPLVGARDGIYRWSGPDSRVGIVVVSRGNTSRIAWFHGDTRRDWCFVRSGMLLTGGRCGGEPNLRSYRPLNPERFARPSAGGIITRL